MNKKITIIFLILLFFQISCTPPRNIKWIGNPQRNISGNYTYKTECAGVEGDGSQTVIAWGNGRNRFDATEQAKKNAVRDVIFQGIKEGKDGCNTIAILNEVNVRQKNDDYFNLFFKDEGEYLNFVSLRDERIGNKIIRDRKSGRKSISHSIMIRVDRPNLKSKFIKDGILKK